MFVLHSWISLVKRSHMGISGAFAVPRLIWIGMLSTTNKAQTSFMLVRRKLDEVVLSEICQLFAKITKNTISGHTSSFFDF